MPVLLSGPLPSKLKSAVKSKLPSPHIDSFLIMILPSFWLTNVQTTFSFPLIMIPVTLVPERPPLVDALIQLADTRAQPVLRISVTLYVGGLPFGTIGKGPDVSVKTPGLANVVGPTKGKSPVGPVTVNWNPVSATFVCLIISRVVLCALF